jgi:hypothetical protein
MIDEPGWTAGRRISSSPVGRARGEQAQVFAEATELDRERAQRGRDSRRRTPGSAGPRGGSEAGRKSSPAIFAELRDRLLAEAGRVLIPVPAAVAPERQLPQAVERGVQGLAPVRHRGAEGPEFLVERDRNGVHQVGARGLDDPGKLARLALGRTRRAPRLPSEPAADRDRGHVQRGREGVVGGLAEVDVVRWG